jgi:hypothetical protein
LLTLAAKIFVDLPVQRRAPAGLYS